jgi:S-DNA-T family DNA segregation ATPase FtsK/SpoIIIE
MRIQGCFVSERELRALARYWKGAHVSASPEDTAVQRPLWPEMEIPDTEDDLLEEAIKLVRQHRRASPGFLQRRLRVGRPRAARLMELMQERGLISSSREVSPEGEEPVDDLP